MVFTQYFIIEILIMFSVFLLESPYYDIKKGSISTTLGDIGFYTEIVIIIADFLVGPLLDFIGRKYSLIIGLLIGGVLLIVFPYGGTAFPWFFLMRMVVSIGLLPALNSPLAPDYI